MAMPNEEELKRLSEEQRKELYIEWLFNRAAAAGKKDNIARFTAQMLLDRLEALWGLDAVMKETWQSEAALRVMRFAKGCEEKGRGT